jgi:hypothetical protein
VPAIVLFKYLRSKAEVTGPLHGLKLKLGGAFAAYFATVIWVNVLLVQFNKKDWEVWKVTGTIQTDADSRILHGDDVAFTVIPPMGELYLDKTTFKIDIVVPLRKDGQPEFPKLFVTREPSTQFETATIPLDEHQLPSVSAIRDNDEHEIKLNKPIELKRVSAPYDGNGPTPTRVPVQGPSTTARSGE